MGCCQFVWHTKHPRDDLRRNVACVKHTHTSAIKAVVGLRPAMSHTVVLDSL